MTPIPSDLTLGQVRNRIDSMIQAGTYRPGLPLSTMFEESAMARDYREFTQEQRPELLEFVGKMLAERGQIAVAFDERGNARVDVIGVLEDQPAPPPDRAVA